MFARQLSQITGLPAVELDKYFWSEDLAPLPLETWIAVPERLAAGDRWIMDGDLGPYDAPEPRLQPADTVVVLDLSLARCVWRAVWRSWEGRGFWVWLVTWRCRSRSKVLHAVASHAPHARLRILRSPSQVRCFLNAALTAH